MKWFEFGNLKDNKFKVLKSLNWKSKIVKYSICKIIEFEI